MKKIILMMLVMVSMSVKMNAQWFVGGGANFGYLKDNFQFALHPQAGYEFNDRWAVGFGLGFSMVSSDVYFMLSHMAALIAGITTKYSST